MPSDRAHEEALQLAQQAQAKLIQQLKEAQQMKREIQSILARAKDDPQARAELLALEAKVQGPWGEEQKRRLASLQHLEQLLPKQADAPQRSRRPKYRSFL